MRRWRRRHLFGDAGRHQRHADAGDARRPDLLGRRRRHRRRHHDLHRHARPTSTRRWRPRAYASAPTSTAPATVTISVTDDVGGIIATGSGAATSDSDVVNVTVTPANDPVTSNAPATATGGEDTRDRRSSACRSSTSTRRWRRRHLLGDAGRHQRHADAGRRLPALTFTRDDGTADATMTFTGTLADINTALATASYTPGAQLQRLRDGLDLGHRRCRRHHRHRHRRRDQRQRHRQRHGDGGQRSGHLERAGDGDGAEDDADRRSPACRSPMSMRRWRPAASIR